MSCIERHCLEIVQSIYELGVQQDKNKQSQEEPDRHRRPRSYHRGLEVWSNFKTTSACGHGLSKTTTKVLDLSN